MGETSRIKPGRETSPIGGAAPAPARGVAFYIQGSWVFFKKMWPAIYDLTTTETYVNASAIAFNILLSFFSFVVLIGSFLLNVLNWTRGYETLYRLLRAVVPKESGMLFTSLDRVTQGPGGKATIISFALLVFSCSGIFQPIELALNQAWGFKERGMAKQYAVYLGLVLVCGVIMLFPVLLGSIYDLVLEAAFGNAPIRDLVFKIIGPVITLPFSILIFFVIYYLVPHGQVAVKQVLFTSVAMAILWVVATLIYRLALPLFDFEESYRGLASLMALITWVFITSFILILGANLSVREVVPKTWTGLLPFRLKAKADAARKDEQASMMSPNLPGH